MKKIKQKGFTLVEFIVVMAIIAVLVLLAFPLFKGYTERARLTQVINDIKVTENAAEEYYLKTGLWPRSYQTGSAMTKSFIETSLNPLLNKEGEEATLEDTGLYFAVDYNVLRKYMSLPERHDRFIIQNPVGEVFYVSDFGEYYSDGSVTPVPMTDFNINNPNLNIVQGETVSINVDKTPANTTESLTYSSSNSSVATVDSSGNVTGVSDGITTITISSSNGTTKTANVTVVSSSIPVTDFTINDSNPSVTEGESLSLDISKTPSDATETLNYSSSNESIATVDANGNVIGVSSGTATITISSSNGTTKTVAVEVTSAPIPVSDITINNITPSVSIGESLQLDISITPIDSTNQELIYSSSDTSVATVTNNGLITGHSEGNATITVISNNGISKTTNISVMALSSSAQKVFTFSFSSFFLDDSNELWALGYNAYGELGIGYSSTRELTPKKVLLSNVKKVVGGSYSTLFLTNSNEIYAVGANSNGELGLGNNNNYTSPAKINLNNVIDVEQNNSSRALFALTDTFEVYSWGINNYGQLGLGHKNTVTTPTKMNISNIKKIYTGHFHAFALTNDGTVLGWGNNYRGQLGLGNNSEQLTPIEINEISDVKEISAGFDTAAILKNNGEVWTAGHNNVGQIGNGTSTTEIYNFTGPILTNVKSVSAGSQHFLALKNDGTVWSWGSSLKGAIGREGDNNIPLQVNIQNIESIISNGYSNLAVDVDGNVWVWGDNGQGQLGFSDTQNKLVPTLNPLF